MPDALFRLMEKCVFFILDFRNKGDASNINLPPKRSNGGCMKVKKIDKDEKHDLEFKQNWRDEYLKWICAFANTHGGSLYIGVKDNGEFWRSGGGMPAEQAIS